MPIDSQLLVAFVLTTTIAMIVPGPDMLFVMACGAKGGPRAGILATAGVAVSEAIHVTVAAAGLTAVFLAVPTLFTLVRVLGAGYLVYLGVQAIRHRGSGLRSDPANSTDLTGRRAFSRGLMTNLLNPKMVTFTVALLPQFVAPEAGPVWLQFAILGVILVVLEFLVDGTVGIAAGRLSQWLRSRRRVQTATEVAVGGVFIGVGAKLAWDSR